MALNNLTTKVVLMKINVDREIIVYQKEENLKKNRRCNHKQSDSGLKDSALG